MPRELGEVAEALDIPFIHPAWVKANICLVSPDIASLTEMLVDGTTLLNAQGRPALEIKGATDPCLKQVRWIAAQFPPLPVNAQLFPKLAYGRRSMHGIALEETTLTSWRYLHRRVPLNSLAPCLALFSLQIG